MVCSESFSLLKTVDLYTACRAVQIGHKYISIAESRTEYFISRPAWTHPGFAEFLGDLVV